MRLSFVCIEDVHHLYAARLKVIRNQRPMTTPPHGFCAHDRSGSSAGSKTEKALNTFAELFCLHVIGVTAERFIAPSCIGGILPWFSSATKLGKMFVENSGFAQRARKHLSVELRITPRSR
jgi:hypothetical protein